MNIQLNTATSTMRALQKKIDTIANNIANVNTTGYKQKDANFSDTLVQSIEKQAGTENEIGRITPNGLRVGTGMKVSQTKTDLKQGPIQETGRELDFTIDGEHAFFRVSSEGNTYYTRDGSFQLEPVINANQVQLVTATGELVLDSNNNPIVFDADYSEINVNPNGTIQVLFNNPPKPPATFQLSIAVINSSSSLESVGSNRYQLAGTEEEQINNGNLEIINLAEQADQGIQILQGKLEKSNVELTEEMSELILTQRLFQSQARAITYANDMMGLVNNIRG